MLLQRADELRRALVEGAWAYRYPAKVSRHLQLRLEKLPAEVQAISWKAQVRLCKRYRQLTARGKHVNQVVVAIAREIAAFAWAMVNHNNFEDAVRWGVAAGTASAKLPGVSFASLQETEQVYQLVEMRTA